MARVPARAEPPIASFCLDKTEVTVRDYARCVDAGECKEPVFDDDEAKFATWAEPRQWNMPINLVDTEHITAFCRFIGGRVPTYEEWMWAWDKLSYDRYHERPGKYQPQLPDPHLLPQPPTEPCSEPRDIVGDGICNLGGGWKELVIEPRNERDSQLVKTDIQSSVTDREEDLRRVHPPQHHVFHPAPHIWFTFRCAR